MNDFDKILWGFIFSTMGIVLGWLLNQTGQWFKTRHEDKRNLKQVIFNLLELYHWFLRCDFHAINKLITDKVFEKISNAEQTDQTRTDLNKLFSDYVMNYIKPEILEELHKIEGSFQISIKSLSNIDPLAAFYLSGKTSILEKFEIIEKWFQTVGLTNPEDASEIELVEKQVIKTIKTDLLKDELKELEEYIFNIALKVNPVMWFRTRRMVIRMKKLANEGIDKKIDDLLNKLSISSQ